MLFFTLSKIKVSFLLSVISFTIAHMHCLAGFWVSFKQLVWPAAVPFLLVGKI